MENIQYTIGHKYLVISQNRIQSRRYLVNKVTIGTLEAVTNKTFIFSTELGIKRIRKHTITKLIDITHIAVTHTQYFIDSIEGALV